MSEYAAFKSAEFWALRDSIRMEDLDNVCEAEHQGVEDPA